MPKELQEILSGAKGLKHNYYIVIKVSEMLEDFNASINAISKVINTDQALTATILKHCNSAQYGFARKITTIRDAISIIGFKVLKTIIFTIVSKSSFSGAIEGYGLADGELWKNSISCAFYAKHIAKLVDYEDPDQAYTAGLVRDIGKLILHKHVKQDLHNIMDLVNNHNLSFDEAEEKIIGHNHCQVGAYIAGKWNFPRALQNAIRYHHSPAEARDNGCEDLDLVRIIHLSDYLAVAMGQGIGFDGMIYNVDPDSLKNLGFTSNTRTLEKLVSEMVNLNEKIGFLAVST